MNSARWDLMHRLFEAALERPQETWRAFVESGCGGDEELLQETLSLLESGVLDEMPVGWLGALAGPEVDCFAPRERVADRYVVRRLIGRGGMGEVYEADDEELGITVALKTLRDVGRHRERLELLKLEGMLARAVWHPNVCRVYELGRHGDDDPLWFLTMERLEGATLAERMREEPCLSLEHALRIAEQIGGGLAAAHRAGVVHRDLKPGNVMLVVRDGVEQAVVTDFGAGRAAPRSAAEANEHQPGVVVGTRAYMAPEQMRGEGVGLAADIYAFGVVLHEMVTGDLPSDASPELDARWDAVIRRCLDPDPRRRFERADDVAEALAGRVPVETASAVVGVATPRSTLPAERDRFVGRTSDLETLERARRDGARLMSLVGPGGMGKTRLATRFAWRTADAWPGGIWFCDLTEARDADGVASAVGRSLGVQLGPGDPIRQLGHAIAGRGACLLILDNFEQVLACAPATIGRWRSQAPDAVFLVTTREHLGLEDERAYSVEPLASEEAVELFTLRARGLRPGLEFADADVEAAREIVRLLDGIPLAIELAAARVRVMNLAQILEGTRKRFRLLAGGSGARHETLEVAIDGSWELLTPWEREAWSQCAVFEAGGTLEALGGVLDLGAWPEAPPIVDIVRALVDKSLLRSWVPSTATGAALPDVRFGMYVTLQEYARAKLRASADAERAAEERHGAFYARYESEEAIAAVELENLMAACRRAVARGDGGITASAYRAAWRVLKTRGPLGAAIALGRDALEAGRLQGVHRAMVAGTLGEAEWLAGRYDDAHAHCTLAVAISRDLADARLEAKFAAPLGRVCFSLGREDEAGEAFTSAVAASRSVGNRHALCAALNGLGMWLHEKGRIEEARSAYEEALETARDLGDRMQEAVTLGGLAILHNKRGRVDEASALYEAALRIHQETGNRRSEGIVHSNLVGVRTVQRRTAEARAHGESALAIARAIGSRASEGVSLGASGELCLDAGELEEARARFEASLAIQREVGNRRVEGIIVANLARVDELNGELDQALARYQSALAIHRETRDRHYEAACLSNLGNLLFERGSHQESRDALAAAEPILRELAARRELARMLCVRAELEHASANPAGARSALDEAESLAAEVGTPDASELGRALARARRRLDGPSDLTGAS